MDAVNTRIYPLTNCSPSLPNTAHAQQNEEVIEKLVCKEIAIVNKDGERVVNIVAIGDDGGGIGSHNKDGERVVNIAPTRDGSGGIDIYNKDGKQVVRMGTTIAGNGFIQSFKGGWKTH